MSTERPTRPDDDEAHVVIAVVRTGGIAGIRRRWKVDARPSEASDWVALIERCPWGVEADADASADRYVWSIRARTPENLREQELSETALDGPWLELVEAVRAASRAAGAQ